VFVASDHGFGTTTEVFHLNKWLHDQGYLHWIDSQKMAQPGQLTEGRMSSHVGLIDYEKTTAYAWTPSSNGIYIRVSKGPGKTGIPPQEYDAFREKIKKSLLDFRCPTTNRKVIKHVFTREEAFPGKYKDLAPDLMVALYDSALISILNADATLKPRTEPAGCHNPEGIFLARGPGIKKDVRISSPMKIVDVAPTLLYSLGLPVPRDFEGQVLTEVFNPEFLHENAVVIGEKTRAVGTDDSTTQGETVPDEKEGIMSQLRTLGYIE